MYKCKPTRPSVRVLRIRHNKVLRTLKQWLHLGKKSKGRVLTWIKCLFFRRFWHGSVCVRREREMYIFTTRSFSKRSRIPILKEIIKKFEAHPQLKMRWQRQGQRQQQLNQPIHKRPILMYFQHQAQSNRTDSKHVPISIHHHKDHPLACDASLPPTTNSFWAGENIGFRFDFAYNFELTQFIFLLKVYINSWID